MRSILALICIVALSGVVHGSVKRCGTGRSCVDGMSTCVRGTCKCNDPESWGDPSFACYGKDDVAVEIKNDPMVRTFGNESFQFPYPCRYLVTHVEDELKDKNEAAIGRCEFMVHAYNGKYRGKFYTLGFDVAARLHYYDSDRDDVAASSRVYGVGRNGRYIFRLRGTMDEFLPDGPWGRRRINYRDNANDLRMALEISRKNNQVVFDVDRCSFRITFVPYDVSARREQISVPGLSVTMKNAYHMHTEPMWLDEDNSMGLAPLIAGGRHLADLRRRGLSIEQSMLYRAFVADIEQNQPYEDRGQCKTAGSTMLRCSRRRRVTAMKHCDWMLLEPKFIFCYDHTTGAKQILQLYNMCLEVHCGLRSCSEVTEAIQHLECEEFGQTAAKFVRSNRCRSQ